MTTGSYDSLKKTSNINTCMTFFKVQFFIIQSLLNLRSCLGNFLSRDQKRTTRNKFGNKNRKEASSIILFFRNGRPEINLKKKKIDNGSEVLSCSTIPENFSKIYTAISEKFCRQKRKKKRKNTAITIQRKCNRKQRNKTSIIKILFRLISYQVFGLCVSVPQSLWCFWKIISTPKK